MNSTTKSKDFFKHCVSLSASYRGTIEKSRSVRQRTSCFCSIIAIFHHVPHFKMLVKSHILFSLILEHATQKYCLKIFFFGLSAVVLKIFLPILKLGSNIPATILKNQFLCVFCVRKLIHVYQELVITEIDYVNSLQYIVDESKLFLCIYFC